MSYSVFHFVHLGAVLLLAGVTFYAIAATDNRKNLLRWSGIASLVVLISGFGLLGVSKMGFPLWAIVKVVVWLLLAAMAGMAFRISNKQTLVFSTVFLLLVASAMVAFKPF